MDGGGGCHDNCIDIDDSTFVVTFSGGDIGAVGEEKGRSQGYYIRNTST